MDPLLLRLREAFSRLFRVGTRGLADPRRSKRIILANQIACSLGTICFLHVFIDRAMGTEILGWLNIPNGLAFFGILLLNRAGRAWASRFALVTYAALYILMYVVGLGKAAGMHLFFLPACWAPLVLFGWDERKSLLYGVILNSGLLVACEFLVGEQGKLYVLSAAEAARMHSDNVITTLVIQILIAAYFAIGNHRAEAALGEAVEAAKSADRSKSRFLANMSHEIRTPLNGVLGIAQLLLKSPLPAANREMVQTIASSSQDLMDILNEILDLSKIEAGKMELEKRPFDLGAAVSAALAPFTYEAQRKGLWLKLDRDPSAPDWVSGDSVRFKQVLRNLAGNAFKFTAEGGVTVRIRKGALPDWLDFEVEDTGPGIPADAKGRIFQTFSQADDSTARKYGGTGLGLAISKQIVELMGGSIGFRDRTGAGTGTIFRFTAHLPAALPPADSRPREGAGRNRPGDAPEASAGRLAKPSCLIVDDHPVNRKVLASMLKEFGLEADSAEGGQEALDACAGRDYDLVFTDCHMPGIDGVELTRRLRERNPAGKVRIIGVTADVMPGMRERCLEAGMDELLPKPVILSELKRILAKVLPPAADARTEAPAPGPAWTWVDTDQVMKLLKIIRKGSSDRLDWMLPTLRENMQTQLRAARSSLEKDDWDSGREALHCLKGLCLNMGLARMAESCRDLERSLDGGKVADWTATARALEEAMEPSLRELQSIATAIQGRQAD